MDNFTFYSPTKFVFGKDTEQNAGALIKEFGGSKVLLHFGGKSAEKSGLLGRVRESEPVLSLLNSAVFTLTRLMI